MKRTTKLIVLLVFLIALFQFSYAQEMGRRFKMEGTDPTTLTIDKTFTSTTEILPFDKNVNKVYGLSVSAHIQFNNESGVVRFILIDKNHDEYLIYESHPLLEGEMEADVDQICEETALLKNDVKVGSIKIEITDAEVNLKSISYTRNLGQGVNIEQVTKEIKRAQLEEKVIQLNNNLQAKNKHWVAGITSVAEMNWSDRKKLYGNSNFPAGFEFYAGGVITTGTPEVQLKSASATSPYIDEWDWRNRHGQNWISPVTNQGSCGSCWAFASTGATEALVNVFFNQNLNLNLSEEDILSCSGGGDCNGGYPSTALNYITNTGIVDETAFPYNSTYQSCSNKSQNPTQLIKISGKIDFGSTLYPKTEDDLKKMLIQMGPVSGGLYDWSHAMVLVGYKVVKEGDVFYYRDLSLSRYWKTISAGDPLIGKTVWIFKNSWGSYFGDNGYVYVETSISNMGWTHAIKTPVISVKQIFEVKCTDNDGDGYYWWGLGPKPANCPSCPELADGDDSDPTKGPLDQYGYCTNLNNPPVADFTSSKTKITEGETVIYSYNSSTSTASLQWTFEGGEPSTSNEKNPTVKYNSAGSYGVKLVASNPYGTNTKNVANYITAVKVYCTSKGSAGTEWINSVKLGTTSLASGSSGSTGYQDLTGSYTFNRNAGSSQTFTLTPGFSGNALGEYWRIWIDYNGDMDFEDAGELVYTSTMSTGSVSGSFTLPSGLNILTRMRISMKRGGIPSPCELFSYGEVEDYLINISDSSSPVPIAAFTANNTSITAGGTITFADQSSNKPTSWSWSFPGGTPSTSTSQNPTVQYSTAGTYNVTLTATNAAGSNTITKTGYITVNSAVIAPIAAFTANNTSITAGGTITFADQSSNKPTSWSWSFPGGTPSTSTSQNPTVQYSTAGTYNVTLTATNTAGSNTITKSGYITVNAAVLVPVASFTASSTIITAGQTVTFTDLSTNSPSSWSWNFAGGSPLASNAKNPTVTYSTPGIYTVSLTASNSAGSNTKTISGYITVNEVVLAPVADFSADNTVVTKGTVVNFIDKSINNPTSWNWSFSGGNTTSSTAKNPSVKYDIAGTYDVVLTVNNAGGNNTKTVLKYITVTEPIPTPQAEYCTPVGLTSTSDFINSVTISNGIKNYTGGNGYSLYEGGIMTPGKSYTIALTPQSSTTRYFWRVWIDYNEDGDFDDSDETVLSAANKKGTVKSTITIPSISSSTIRMRVSMKLSAYATACEGNYKGEVEDYNIIVGQLASSNDNLSSGDENYSNFYTPIDEFSNNQSDLKVYPNPVVDNLNFKINNPEPDDTFVVFDLAGKKLVSDKVNSVITNISMSEYAPGIYILQVKNGGNIYREKIIKK